MCALIVGSLIGLSGMIACAGDSQAEKDENMVVGACMVQKFKEKKPPIAQAKIEKCGDVDAKAAPKCLGLSDDEYLTIIKFCVAQLTNAKCVSAKMKVPLINYADCGYEPDPAGCYKALGFTTDAIVKLSTDCEKEGAK